MKRAYKLEIKPTDRQREKLIRTFGVCRYVYNMYIATNITAYKEGRPFMSGYDFSKWLNNVHVKQRQQDLWIKSVSSKAVKQSIMNAERAYKNFFKGLSKYPRFKKKARQDIKAYFPKNNQTDFEVKRHQIKVPTLGWVTLKEYGYLPKDAVIKSGTVSQKADRFYISVLCEVPECSKQTYESEGIGIDLGIKDFAIMSNGKVYKNINKTDKVRKLEKRLKQAQRKLSRSYEQNKKVGENCYFKNRQKQICRVQKLHQRLANIRENYQKHIVNDLVKTKPAFITLEDLNVRGMMKNRHLSKAIAQQGFFNFRTKLQMKCEAYGIELRLVNRFYPSSKLCSVCGHKKVDLTLKERVYECTNCHKVLDRDLNAAMNLKQATQYELLVSV
ncbi:RNA-guided endonuclease InsQ/TnpB family protein [Kurthia massiliensis]|uniref:RNA-guided endonuclease InsQ/TnpB family protein n=1 Tax=Kurthia massiliensis TaxID=1033739 RepID=UPI0002880A4F|nr:RNA-guided endonuclease TnpB family protein [Kurthia massiliensis]